MNGIDAIFALLALTAGFGVLIGTVNEINNNSKGSIDSANAKGIALTCSGIIDSMITNSANSFTGKMDCDANGEIVTSTQNWKDKNAHIIGKAVKEKAFIVETKQHYFE